MSLVPVIGVFLDGIFVGNMMGIENMAAFGIGLSFQFLITSLGGIVEIGGETRLAYHQGKADREAYRKVYTLCVLYTLLIGIASVVAGAFFSDQIAALLGAREELIPLAGAYIKGLTFINIPFNLARLFISFVRVDGSAKLASAAVIVMAAAKIGFSYLFLGPMQLDLFWLAIALGVSSLFAIAICALHFRKKTCELRLTRVYAGRQESKKIFAIGAAFGSMLIADAVAIAVTNMLLYRIGGAVAVGAYALVFSISDLVIALPGGVSESMRLVCSTQYSIRSRSGMRRTFIQGMKIGLLVTAVASVLICIFAQPIVLMFNHLNPELIQMATEGVRYSALMYLLYQIGSNIVGYYQSCEHNVLATVGAILECCVLQLVAAFLLVDIIGITAIWLSLTIGEAAMILTIWIYHSIRKRRPAGLNDYLYLDVPLLQESECELQMSGNIDQTNEAGLLRRFEDACGNMAGMRFVGSPRGVLEEYAMQLATSTPPQHAATIMDLRCVCTPGMQETFYIWHDGAAFEPVLDGELQQRSHCVYALKQYIFGLNYLVLTFKEERHASQES